MVFGEEGETNAFLAVIPMSEPTNAGGSAGMAAVVNS